MSAMKTLASLVFLALVVAACGNETSSPPTSGAAPSPTPISTAPPPAQQEPGGAALPVSAGVGRADPDPGAPVDAMVAGLNDAGFELLRRLPPSDNVVFGPTSIGHALLMAAAAGDEPTGAAIEEALGLPEGAHDAWNAIDLAIAGSQSDQVTVTIADRIWPRTGLAPDQDWVDLLASRHGADVVPLDFVNDGEGSRRAINDWVGDRTDGLIPELLPEGFIQPTTVLVLTDAMYFAADWATPFGKYGPVPGTFTTLDGTEVEVSFMQELELADRRGVGDGFVGAEIPYAGDEYSMLVLVPEPGRYEELIERLDQQLLDEIDASFTTGPYELLLPKWDDDFQVDLIDWLTELGAAPGRYPAIAPDAFLSGAVHAADIAVDEQGTVAAAATALGFEESGPPEPELTVAADKPFVYLIRHRPTGLVLFAGHVTDPG